ncbi:hypothetical protein IFM89_022486 [Coptis chinensis]|uniref:Uncharacterized protein n=1 Tax=Coptis chinensis TaxID=261450 RepID=A0A835IDM7_9MAGN|nr:hypothetical protein IFM89_022486 [Coptis chinensis]
MWSVLIPPTQFSFCSSAGTCFIWGRFTPEDTDAKESLLQAARKAPASALGFRVQCNKWAVIVRLLTGEIHERIVFMQKGMKKALRPYFELTNVSRELNSENPVADAESIVAKAIRDGAIDATIDHANGWMVSKETGDVYSTNEPQFAFNSRIALRLNMHNEAAGARGSAEQPKKEKESVEKRRERDYNRSEGTCKAHCHEEGDDDFYRRCFFLSGKIHTEEDGCKESLLQAARKAPASALGFRVQCNKWAVIVRLLLGEIPERIVFMQKGMKKALRPYFELTNAISVGDLELFRNVADKFASTFNSDQTHNLIVRLRYNVIRTRVM